MPSKTRPLVVTPSVHSSYQVTLHKAVAGGRVGERVGSPAGFSGPSGALPYAHRVATSAAGSVAEPINRRVSVAVGVATHGTAHLTLFTDGKVAGDHTLRTDWANAQALAATANPGTRQVAVLAFGTGGTVTRVVIDDVAVGSTPKAGAPTVVVSGLPEVTAAALAGTETDGRGDLSTYVVAGDRLVLVRAGATGAATVTELVPTGMRGTTTLGRLATGTPAAGGVVAWGSDGVGRMYTGPYSHAALTYAGPAVELPR